VRSGSPRAGLRGGALTAADRPSVSVCFPAYNEEASIGDVLEEADAILAGLGTRYEILVCDDGSSDATGAIADQLAASRPSIRVLHHPRNLGIRETFEHLYSEAALDFIFLNSTDRQWPTAILADMLPMTADYDIVVACRRDKHYGWFRALVSSVYNWLPRLLFGVSTYDAGAVKLMRRSLIDSVRPVSRSPFAEAERLIRASRMGYRIGNLPVETSPRLTGKSNSIKLMVLFQAVADVGRVWWLVNVTDRSGLQAMAGSSSSPPGRR
jgi:glycosyltransferase involved in cell wall biosynthesis